MCNFNITTVMADLYYGHNNKKIIFFKLSMCMCSKENSGG